MPVFEIVSVRAERVQEITHADALAEGVGKPDWPWAFLYSGWKKLWNGINEERGYGFDSNPWVWRVEFRRIVK